MTDASIPRKRCNRCLCEFPATTEYFKAAKREPMGIMQPCRLCMRKENREYYSRPDVKEKERIRKSTPEYKAHEKEYKKSETYKEKARVRDRSEKRKAQKRARLQRPDVKQKMSEKRKTPKERERSREKQRIRRVRADVKEKERDYRNRLDVREHYRHLTQVRRAQQRLLRGEFTKKHKTLALSYFSNTCPVCGNQFNDLFSNRTVAWDHWWIPQSKGGKLDVSNMLPLCHGINGCNNSKCNRDPEEWLIEKYGRKNARQILRRIREYFDWITSQE